MLAEEPRTGLERSLAMKVLFLSKDVFYLYKAYMQNCPFPQGPQTARGSKYKV